MLKIVRGMIDAMRLTQVKSEESWDGRLPQPLQRAWKEP